MNRTPSIRAALLCLLAAAAPARAQQQGAAAAVPPIRTTLDPRLLRGCARIGLDDPLLAGAVSPTGVPPDDASARIRSVRLEGLKTLTAAQVWELLGGLPPPDLSDSEAAGLISLLVRSGLFATVSPSRAPGGVLVLNLGEVPRLTAIEVTGTSEVDAETVRREVLDTGEPIAWPGRRVRSGRAARLAAQDRAHRRSGGWREEDDEEAARGCDAPNPPAEWLARLDGATVQPGLLRGGLARALRRVLRRLDRDGYVLAKVSGKLSPQGSLLLQLDEGHARKLEVVGLPGELASELEHRLATPPGAPFSLPGLRAALREELRDRPWVRLADGARTRGEPAVEARALPDGSWEGTAHPDATAHEAAPDRARERGSRRKAQRRKDAWREHSDDDLDAEDTDAFDFFAHDEAPWTFSADDWRGRGARWREVRAERAVEIDGDVVRVHLRTRLAELDGRGDELFRHTPVTGFAPGLGLTGRLWEPGGRFSLRLDGAFNVNTRRASRVAPAGAGLLERMGADERTDWLVGASIALPRVHLAELGVQLHTLTDTEDRFRLSAGESYLYSALFNRPEAEYFRRSGFTTFATFHFFEGLTLGGELRIDREDGLTRPFGVWTLFHRDEGRDPAKALDGVAAVDAGRYGSVLLRAEWSSRPVSIHHIGRQIRSSALSLVEPHDDGPWEGGLRSLATVEQGVPGLSEGRAAYTRVISDSTAALELGDESALRARVRVAGGTQLPEQRREGLGGWGTLRGYDFKEFRGDLSLLGTLEARTGSFGGFVDLGTIETRAPAGGSSSWLSPHLGSGLQLFLGQAARLEFAWRLDGRIRLVPETRLLFSWPVG